MIKNFTYKILFVVVLIVFLSCKKTPSLTGTDSGSLLGITLFEKKLKIDSTLIQSFKSDDLKLFYQKKENQTVWQSKEQRDFFLNTIKTSDNEGLNPEDYEFTKLNEYEIKIDTLSDAHLIDYDLALSLSALTYISHSSKGKLNPSKIYNDWSLTEKKVDVSQILFDCFDTNNFKIELDKCKPQHFVYKQLIKSLKLLNEFPKDTIKSIQFKGKLIDNKKSDVIRIIKTRLMYWNDMKKNDTITKVFDDETRLGLKKFQSRHGLTPDGLLGRGTIEALNFSKSIRKEQIIANLERWRWYASDFGKSYILTNIPDYTLVAVKNGDTTQSQRIVVGKYTRKTPILESKISNINLNPNWTVPPTILKEDIYPEALKDKGVFKRKGLTIFDRKNKEVNPYSWNMDDANDYKYVQKPNRNNSLGSMKINFPNRFSVYMHDTNHRDFFTLNYRSLSSGCVRLERPLQMAEYLLNDCNKWPIEKIMDTTDIKHYRELILKRENNRLKKEAIKLKKETLRLKKLNILAIESTPEELLEKQEAVKNRAEYIASLSKNLELKTIVIPVKEDILIHQLYWTAWQRNGELQFREDIYCLDQDLFAKLRYVKPEKKKL